MRDRSLLELNSGVLRLFSSSGSFTGHVSPIVQLHRGAPLPSSGGDSGCHFQSGDSRDILLRQMPPSCPPSDVHGFHSLSCGQVHIVIAAVGQVLP